MSSYYLLMNSRRRARKSLYWNLKSLFLVISLVTWSYLRIVPELRLGGVKWVLLYVLEVYRGIELGWVCIVLVVLRISEKKRFVILIQNASVNDSETGTSTCCCTDDLICDRIWVIMNWVFIWREGHLKAA